MRRSNFPTNMYTVDRVEPLPYYRSDIINPDSFEFDMNYIPKQPNAQIPGRWGWNTGFSNGYGRANLQFDLGCPVGCCQCLENTPKGYATKHTIDIYNKYWCKKC